MKELLGRDGQVIHVSLKTNPVDKVASTASSIEEQFFDTAEDLPLKTFESKVRIDNKEDTTKLDDEEIDINSSKKRVAKASSL
ncbi:13549_t:CDS:2 [Rhizophagus irregularis]|nr:13549_t:CDS:2 [Rhizophagus irregularis]